MIAEEWKKIKEVLHEALQVEPAARPALFERFAVGGEIRREVESLLAFETEAGSMMNVSAVDFFSGSLGEDDEEQHHLIGQNLGVYKVVRELGYGGMGAVFLAERADGKFSQRVALKLLKREMNTAALRRRFEQERRILASLEHPNIARLLDSGTTDDKIPYLAMEYVEGLPIDEFCRRNEFDLTRRLELFRKVCAAVNFAHRNLVVHRDLKPSNILVTKEGEPKLLDFGISKILSSDFEPDSSATVTRLGVMTTGYASPEQIKGKSVTTATDIYSLGVILYELLSGHRPFEAKEYDLKEIYQAVLEDEPVAPSRMQREETTGRTGEEEKRRRGEGENSLLSSSPFLLFSSSQLRGDLDNIILKALRKEPERRYSSAENFADDIERFQNGLPVSARPNTFRYRTEKFIKRNRIGVAAFGLVSTAVVGGILATLRQTRVARVERQKAEKRFGDVRELANSYLFDVFPEIEHLEGSLRAREKIVRNALRYLDSLSREAGDDLELQRELARAYEKIGEVQGAVNISNLGDINSGMESYQKAQRLREAVFRAAPHDPEIKEDVAKNYHVIAQTLQWNIDTKSAEGYFREAIRLRRELVAQNQDSIVMRNRLAVLLSDFSSVYIFNVQNEKAFALLDEAAFILRRILKNHPDHFISQKAYPRVLRAYSRLKANAGDYSGALRDLDLSVRLTEELLRRKNDDYTLKRTAWLNDFGYLEVFVAMRDGRRIVESGLKTIDFNLKTLEKEPNESFALFDLAMSYYYIAFGFRLSNEPRRSIEYAEKAFEMMKRLDLTAPGTIYYLRGFAVIETELADSFLLLGRSRESLEYLESARRKMEKVVAADRTVLGFQAELARIYRLLARACDKKGERKQSLEFIDAARRIVSQLETGGNLIFSEKDLPALLDGERAEYAAR